MNYFELLNLEPRYDLDQSLLQKQYLLKQGLYHPDRAKSESERKKNLNISMQLNEAYKTLKDDYMRAEYLLKILKKFDKTALHNVLTASELEAIIESHEEINLINSIQQLQNLKDNKMLEKLKMIQALTKYFASNNITKSLDITVRLKYLTNLIKNIDSKIKYANNRD